MSKHYMPESLGSSNSLLSLRGTEPEQREGPYWQGYVVVAVHLCIAKREDAPKDFSENVTIQIGCEDA